MSCFLQYGAGMQIGNYNPLQVTLVTIQESPWWCPITAVVSSPNTFEGSSGSPLFTACGKLHGLHYAGRDQGNYGVHMPPYMVRTYLEEARRLQIDVSTVERAYQLMQMSRANNRVAIQASEQQLRDAALSLVKHAALGAWIVVVPDHLQSAITLAEQALQQQLWQEQQLRAQQEQQVLARQQQLFCSSNGSTAAKVPRL